MRHRVVSGAAGSQLSAQLFVLRTSDLSAEEIRYLAVAHTYTAGDREPWTSWIFPSLQYHYGPLFGNSGPLLSAVLALSAALLADQSPPELRQSHCIRSYEFMSCFHRRMQEDIQKAETGNINESHILAFSLVLVHCWYNLDRSSTWRKPFRGYLQGLVEIIEEVMRKNSAMDRLVPFLQTLIRYVLWLASYGQLTNFDGLTRNHEVTLARDSFRTFRTFRLFNDHLSDLLPQKAQRPALDLSQDLCSGTMACFQKYYINYWKMGQSGVAMHDELGIMLLDLQKLLDMLLQQVSVGDYFNLVI